MRLRSLEFGGWTACAADKDARSKTLNAACPGPVTLGGAGQYVLAVRAPSTRM